jgi:hypothetical protein
MGKGRERQIILKTDQRTIFLEMGLGGKFQRNQADGTEKDLFCSIRNANGIDVATAGQPDISALIDKGFSKKEGAKLVVRYWLCERTNKPLHSRGPPHMLLRIAVKGENAPSGSAAAVG